MHPKALGWYYGLASFVIVTAIFVMQPSQLPEVTNLQSQIKQSFSIAWQQTIGDQPYLTQVAQIYSGVSEFYNQSANSMIALIEPSAIDNDDAFAGIFHQTYGDLTYLTRNHMPTALAQTTINPAVFMTQPAITNLTPDADQGPGQVLGASTSLVSNPVDSGPWFTAVDGMTGQKYCVAIFDGDVNKYLGACTNEYH